MLTKIRNNNCIEYILLPNHRAHMYMMDMLYFPIKTKWGISKHHFCKGWFNLAK